MKFLLSVCLLATFAASVQIAPLNVVPARLDQEADNMRFTQVKAQAGPKTALDSFLVTPEFSGAASKMAQQDEACAMCQYFVQRIHGAIIQYTQENGQREAKAETKTAAAPTPAPAFLEMESQITQAPAGGAKESTKVGFVLNGRTRNSEFIGAGPPDVRYSPLVLPAEEAMAEREQYKTMQLVVYKMLQDMCATRMPLSFLGYCKNAMDQFRHITQGLHYGDRPDSICLSIQSCAADSYAAIQPHAMTRIDTAAVQG